MITREFNLNLHAGHSIPLVINVSQYESNEQWLFTIINQDGTQYRPASASIVGTKSDGYLIDNEATVDSDGRVVVEVTEQIAAAAGKAVFELRLDDQQHGTANFVVLVEKSPADEGIPSESDLSLIQQAIDGTSATAIAQGVSDWMDENLTPTTPVVDTSLTVSGAAADSAKVGQELSDLKSQIDQSTGMSDDFKVALENLLQYVVYKGDDPTGRTYLTALHNAMYPPAQLTSITAVYTQSGTVYNTDSLDDLKSDLVVTANYDDETSETVTTYTLSGTLTEGTSVITVSYGEMATTFNVTVTVRRVSGDDVWYDGVAYEDLTIVANEYVKYNNGTFVAYNGWSRTGFVYCEGASSITFPPIPESGSGAPQSTAFYSDNSTGTRIKAFQLSKTQSTTVTVPSNAKYFAISSNTSALNSCIEAGIVPNA
ncbi:MAG: BppU family phage baseplate upper protein [Solobacterium sp.]|nr:BppU family phage baseplate upper protein [Solobacterium sp.]